MYCKYIYMYLPTGSVVLDFYEDNTYVLTVQSTIYDCVSDPIYQK